MTPRLDGKHRSAPDTETIFALDAIMLAAFFLAVWFDLQPAYPWGLAIFVVLLAPMVIGMILSSAVPRTAWATLFLFAWIGFFVSVGL